MAELSTKPLGELLDDLERTARDIALMRCAEGITLGYKATQIENAERIRLMVREQIELRFRAMLDAIAAGVDLPEIRSKTQDIIADMEAAEL